MVWGCEVFEIMIMKIVHFMVLILVNFQYCSCYDGIWFLKIGHRAQNHFFNGLQKLGLKTPFNSYRVEITFKIQLRFYRCLS